MYYIERDVLENLLVMIEDGDCQAALAAWSDYKHNHSHTCAHCIYEALGKSPDCCACLESKMRMMSLFEHGGDAYERTLVRAVNTLHAYSEMVLIH